jgi:hypoxanthine phosphoribosyltransferase
VRLASTILFDEAEIQERVDVLARAIAADTPEGTELSVLGILDGAFLFCGDLVRRLPLPVRVGLVRLVSVERGGDPANLVLPEELPIRGRDLLVVEDILDTGRTLGGLVARLEREQARRVRLAVLLDKPARRAVDVRADYVGFRVDERWVVGYGMDSEGLYRNLPYITYVD